MEEMSFGRQQHRAILWTKDGHKRCCFRGGQAQQPRASIITWDQVASVAAGGDHDGDGAMGPKQVLGHLGAAEKADWRSPKEVRQSSKTKLSQRRGTGET